MAFAPAIVMVVAALAYAQAVSGGFVWDDVLIVLDYPFYRDQDLLWPYLWKPFALIQEYYRPLALLSFYVDFRLWGFDAGGFHLTNIILHALTSVLACALLRRAVQHEGLALIGGLLFALHPVHIEPVTWIAGRFDVMMGFFYLLALWIGTAEARTPGVRLAQAGLAGLMAFLALLSKEMALTLVAVLPLYDAVSRTRPTGEGRKRRRTEGHRPSGAQRPYWLLYASLGLAAGVYLLLRYNALGFWLASGRGGHVPVGNALQHMLLVARTVVHYVRLLLWPFGALSPIQYASLPIPVTDLAAWLELGLALGLIAAGVILARRQPRLGGLAACFAISLLPVINILPISLGGRAFAAERFLYLPSFFFILAACVALEHPVRTWLAARDRPGRRWLAPALATGVLAAYAMTIFATVPHWHDDLALWTWAHERAPQSSMPVAGFAVEALERNENELALSYADQALALDPGDASALNARGGALMRLSRPIEAEAAYRQALALRPDFAQYWTGLAEALRVQGRYAEAERILKDEALRRDPYLWSAHWSLGQVYLEWGRPADAIPPLRQAVQLQPRGDAIRRHLAKALAQTGQATEAYQIYAEIIQRDPAGQSDPKNVEVYAEWGDLLWDQGQRDAAKAQYARYLELAPNGPQAGRVKQRLQ